MQCWLYYFSWCFGNSVPSSKLNHIIFTVYKAGSLTYSKLFTIYAGMKGYRILFLCIVFTLFAFTLRAFSRLHSLFISGLLQSSLHKLKKLSTTTFSQMSCAFSSKPLFPKSLMKPQAHHLVWFSIYMVWPQHEQSSNGNNHLGVIYMNAPIRAFLILPTWVKHMDLTSKTYRYMSAQWDKISE